jgi:hypothetical protein
MTCFAKARFHPRRPERRLEGDGLRRAVWGTVSQGHGFSGALKALVSEQTLVGEESISRGAAQECSPRRGAVGEPWNAHQPQRGERTILIR